MNNDLQAVQDKFIGSLSRLCDSFGLNKFVAQLYAILYLSDRPLSLDEMTERLRVSKGNVSINIRELEKMGAVRSVWVKGSRKDYYEANLDVKSIILNKLRSGIQKRIDELGGMLDNTKEILKSQDSHLTPEEKRIVSVYKERFEKIEELRSLAASVLTLTDKLI